MNWKNKLDPVIKDFLISLLKEVETHKKAYLEAEDPAIAQLWVALSIIYRKLLIIEKQLSEISDKFKENDLKKKLEESLKRI